jgi:hypothetical protein
MEDYFKELIWTQSLQEVKRWKENNRNKLL